MTVDTTLSGTSASSVPPAEDAGARPAVRLDHLSKVYGYAEAAVHALDNVSLDIARGEFVCLIGASGCGKSTLLNMIAGLDTPSAGVVDHGALHTTLLFQEAALFPWLTAAKNVELPMKFAKVPRAQRRERAQRLLELVNLGGFGAKRPHELSGGMRQRVALARALAQDVDILLMDEPFGALDAMTRDVLHEELDKVWQTTGVTVVFVTHNVREAARLGDRVVLLSSRPGRVIREYPVEITRPRRMDSPEIAELASQITDDLRAEVSRHGGR
jgi:NitT/TauT family transport system ATP-binding protein